MNLWVQLRAIVLCLALSLLSVEVHAALLPGWPVPMPHPYQGAVALADIDGDGIAEVITAPDKINVTKGDGTPLPGWPQDRLEVLDGALAVGDLDGDGKQEIVGASERGIYVWNYDGTMRAGSPMRITDDLIGAAGLFNVTLADLDGDGKLEIFSASYFKGKVYGWRHDGTPLPGWPLEIQATSFVPGPAFPSLAVGDLDGDGKPELLVPTPQNQVLAFHHDGTAAAGWPVSFLDSPFAVSTADIGTDGKAKVFVNVAGGGLYGLNGDGTFMPGFSVYGASMPAIGDIDGDGEAEIISDAPDGLYAFRIDGSIVDGWPQPHIGSAALNAPALADVDGDGISDVLIRTGGSVYGWHGDGTVLPGFPLPPTSTPSNWDDVPLAVGDINGDGYFDLVTGSGSSDSNIYAYQLPGPHLPQRAPWAMYGHDAQRSFRIMQKPVVVSSALSGVQDVLCHEKLLANGGYPPYAWAITGGALPPGLSLNAATGEISGTPAEAGTFGFTVQVTDGKGTVTTRTVALTVDVVAVTTAELPVASVGSAYSETVGVAGGSAPYAWTVSAGSLPTGLSLNASTGVISGHPTAAGKSTFTLQVSDSQGRQATKTLTLEVTAWSQRVFTGADPDSMTVDKAGNLYVAWESFSMLYSNSLTKFSPSGRLLWEVHPSAGMLTHVATDDAGNVFLAGYLLYGATTGAFVSKYDSEGRLLWTRNYESGMTRGFAVDAAGNSYVSGRMGKMLGNDSWLLAYDAAGGLRWSKTTMPGDAGGVAIGPDGGIYATFATGTSKFDASGAEIWTRPYGSSSEGLFVDKDNNVILAHAIPEYESGLAKMSPSGTTLWYVQLAGVTIRSAAVDGSGNSYLTGYVGTGGDAYAVTMKYDAAGNQVWKKTYDSEFMDWGEAIVADKDSGGVYVGVSKSSAYEFTDMVLLHYAQPAVDTTALTGATVNEPHSQALAASRGVAPYTWSLAFGALPSGLTLDSSTGVISGTPWVAGTYSVPVKVTDAGGVSDLKFLSIAVAPPATPASLDFTATPLWGQAPVLVNFSDTSTTPYTSWSWLFGDGGSGSGKNVSHLYTTPGTYTVTLTASSETSTDVVTREAYIKVLACTDEPVQLNRGVTTPFPGFNAAYCAATDYDIIQLLNGDISETIELDREIRVTVKGGYLCGYTDTPLVTTFTGKMRITAGTVVVENLRFR